MAEAEPLLGAQVGAGSLHGQPKILLKLLTKVGETEVVMSPAHALELINNLGLARRDAVIKARADRQ